MLKIVPATAEMVKELDAKPLLLTLRGATAVIENGKVLGIAGYCLGHESVIVVSRMTDDARASIRLRLDYRKALVKVAKTVLQKAKATGIYIDATADEVDGALETLTHYGFKPYGSAYRWHGSH